MKTTNSSSDLLQSRQTTLVGSNQKYMRRASLNTTTQKQSTHLVNSRRPDLTAVGNDFLTQRSSSNFSAPRLVGVMNKFFQASQTMEEEIMLPSRLKDMPIEGTSRWPTSVSATSLTVFFLSLLTRTRNGQFDTTGELARTLLICSRDAQSTEMYSSILRRGWAPEYQQPHGSDKKIFQRWRRCDFVQPWQSTRFVCLVNRLIGGIGAEHRHRLVHNDQRRYETALLRPPRLLG